jgi:hypothetical protein
MLFNRSLLMNVMGQQQQQQQQQDTQNSLSITQEDGLDASPEEEDMPVGTLEKEDGASALDTQNQNIDISEAPSPTPIPEVISTTQENGETQDD